MSPENISAFFSRLRDANPAPRGELSHINPYTLLVAVVLSAQATDVGVNKATKDLFMAVQTPEEMLALGVDRLKEHIRTIGLYNNKAKSVMALSHMLIEEYDGQVPDNMEALVRLAGVGRKTANVVLNIAFGQPTCAVDTHVFRVANRTGLAPETTPDKVELALLEVIPDEFGMHAHHWLILHGRYICKARRPDCSRCSVEDLCGYGAKETS